jgi:hypothetical protein
VGVLFGSQVFQRPRREKLIHSPPDVIFAVTSFGPTARWGPALRRLGQIAPTIVVGETTVGALPSWATAPEGWRQLALSGTPSLTILRYEPLGTPRVAQDLRPERVGSGAWSVEN